MIDSTNSSSSDGYALIGKPHLFGAGPTDPLARSVATNEDAHCHICELQAFKCRRVNPIVMSKKGNIMYPGTFETSTDINTPLVAITPTTQLTALYAEYDDVLDALEVLHRKLTSVSRLRPLTRYKLRTQRNDLCDALADVHEKIADFDFVLM